MKAGHPRRAHSLGSSAHLRSPRRAARVQRAGGVGAGSGRLSAGQRGELRGRTAGARTGWRVCSGSGGGGGGAGRALGTARLAACDCGSRACCITPFIALGLAASQLTPGYESQADVMLLIASPENQPN